MTDSLPPEAQHLFLRVFNVAAAAHGEESAFRIAWQGVQNAGFAKVDDHWERIKSYEDAEFAIPCKIEKIEEDREKSGSLKVWLWAYKAIDADGNLVIDKHREIIPWDLLEEASFDFTKNQRTFDSDHDKQTKGSLIEGIFMTPEKRVAMGLDGTGPVGWFVGAEITEPRTIQRIKSGDLKEGSIHFAGPLTYVDTPDGKLGVWGRIRMKNISLVTQGAAEDPSIVLVREKGMAKEKEQEKMDPENPAAGTMRTLDDVLAALPEEDRAIVLAAIDSAMKAEPPKDPNMPPKPEEEEKASDDLPPEEEAIKSIEDPRVRKIALEAYEKAKELQEKNLQREAEERYKGMGLQYTVGASLPALTMALRLAEKALPKEAYKALEDTLAISAEALKQTDIHKMHGTVHGDETPDPKPETKEAQKAKEDAEAFQAKVAKIVSEEGVSPAVARARLALKEGDSVYRSPRQKEGN